MSNTVECPYCKFENEMKGSHVDDEGQHECEKCEKEFYVTIEYDPTYYAECTEENHDFEEENDINNTSYLFCKFCKKGKRK